ncbi:MAG: YicC family protein [Bacteroidales bacterium]|nr:YicC family protein [Bacteroidales bacterium]MCL2738021.1 YicC family protein [Bacteroidales bacterium]
MIRSMTGYGRAETCVQDAKIIIEIRSVNGRSADINLKGALIPRHKETELRQMLAAVLQRGSIDLYISWEHNGQIERPINRELFLAYCRQISDLQKELSMDKDSSGLLSAVLRIPEVMERKNTEPDEQDWAIITAGIGEALGDTDRFRLQEGARLERELLERVELIESYTHKVEELEAERMEGVRGRLLGKLNELEGLTPDANRFEQELIYYLEKWDITEEKVRLRQHCAFFKQTAKEEPYPGRKLGFIAQEMGREINTMGSKANHASMQQWVVMMKDELEKIKEQGLNIL